MQRLWEPVTRGRAHLGDPDTCFRTPAARSLLSCFCPWRYHGQHAGKWSMTSTPSPKGGLSCCTSLASLSPEHLRSGCVPSPLSNVAWVHKPGQPLPLSSWYLFRSAAWSLGCEDKKDFRSQNGVHSAAYKQFW